VPRKMQGIRLLALLVASSLVTFTVTERLPEPEGSGSSADSDARLLFSEARVRELEAQVEELQARAAEREARGVCLGQQTTTRDGGYVRPAVIYGHLHMAKTGGTLQPLDKRNRL
jgi:hypothetical protein